MGYKVFRAVALTMALLTSIGFGAAAETSSPAASPTQAPPAIAPLADKLLTEACQALASTRAFTFHAEILFDQVLPHDVKVQFRGRWTSRFSRRLNSRSTTRAISEARCCGTKTRR